MVLMTLSSAVNPQNMDVNLDEMSAQSATAEPPRDGARDPSTPNLTRQKGNPCSSSGKEKQHGSVQPAFILLPDGGYANRRYIELGTGTTVLLLIAESAVASVCEGEAESQCDQLCTLHTRLHPCPLWTVVRKEFESDNAVVSIYEGWCRIKYIGRNCRVVVVGGVLLKFEQEIAVRPGTHVILNFNNKGLPLYSYTLVAAYDLPSITSTMLGRRTGSASMSLWRSPPLADGRPRRATKFRKEDQGKLEKEREDIINRLADLKFG